MRAHLMLRPKYEKEIKTHFAEEKHGEIIMKSNLRKGKNEEWKTPLKEERKNASSALR